MATQKRKRYEYESDPGSIWILHALAEQLPDVFTAEILPKLDMKDTLNLAQVNKTYNAAVWSVGGVRSLEAKLKAHVEKTGENRVTEPMIQAVSHGNVPCQGPPRVRGGREQKDFERPILEKLELLVLDSLAPRCCKWARRDSEALD